MPEKLVGDGIVARLSTKRRGVKREEDKVRPEWMKGGKPYIDVRPRKTYFKYKMLLRWRYNWKRIWVANTYLEQARIFIKMLLKS